MMPAGPLDFLSLPALFGATILVVLLSIEAGFQLGRRRAQVREPEKETSVGAMVGASLGLLAFLLAFTFGLAASRFEARRMALLNEVNAIGTAHLRTGALPEPERSEARRLLREYVDVRLEAVRSSDFETGVRRSKEIHGELFSIASALGAQDPRSIVVGLFTESLNDVIDLHTVRITEGSRVRIPGIIWIVLYTITVLAMLEMGYQTGLAGRRRPLSTPALALAFASVILLVADLDRPQQGVIRVSQAGLEELQEDFRSPERGVRRSDGPVVR